MKQLLHHLHNLGFTEIESKIIVDLAEHGPAGGYEVAKRLGASRSNVYAAMQRMERQGALQRESGEPIRYRALKPEDLTEMIMGRTEASLAYVEKSLPRHGQDEEPFQNVEGDQAVLKLAAKKFANAEHEIVVDIWPEEATMLRKELKAAENRGVRVIWACDGPDNGLARTLAWPGWKGLSERNHGGRKFSFVIDREWCMLGMRGGEMDTQALVSSHPVMAELLLQHFSQEMVLFELEQDMGSQLEEKYGSHYGAIQSKYIACDQVDSAEEEASDKKES